MHRRAVLCSLSFSLSLACNPSLVGPDGARDREVGRTDLCPQTACDRVDHDSDGWITNDDLTGLLVCAFGYGGWDDLHRCMEDATGDGSVDTDDIVYLMQLQGRACSAEPPCDDCEIGADDARDRLDLLEEMVGIEDFPRIADLRIRQASTDALGYTRLRIEHAVDCVPVEGDEAILTTTPSGEISHFAGRLRDAAGTPTTPLVAPADAISAAQAAVDPTRAAPLRRIDLRIVPDDDDAFSLAWVVSLDGGAASAPRVEVDAIDAERVRVFETVSQVRRDIVGTGVSNYSGEVPLLLLEEDELLGQMLYHPSARDINLRTLSTAGRPSGNEEPVAFTAAEARGAPSVVDLHYGATTFLHWLEDRGRAGLDGDWGPRVWSPVFEGDSRRFGVVADVVEENPKHRNAAWYDPSTQTAYFSAGDGIFRGPITSLDIVAHELTHAIHHAVTPPGYRPENNAAKEHLADAIATGFVAEILGPHEGMWQIAEDTVTPGVDDGLAVRYLDDPPADGESVIHLDDWRGPDVEGYDRRHYNAGIGNTAFYLASEGGTHPDSGTTVTRIGLDKTTAIWFRALTTHLPALAQLADVRVATLAAAVDLYGPLSTERHSVATAWEAVGIGPAGTSRWQNQAEPLDTNGDGFISSIDALLVLNDMNLSGSRMLGPADPTDPKIDTNGDGAVSPIDALLVLNELNERAGM